MSTFTTRQEIEALYQHRPETINELLRLSDRNLLTLFNEYVIPEGSDILTMYDPYVDGTVAVRVVRPDQTHDDYIFTRGCQYPDECAFNTWPPTTGHLRFF